MEGVTPPRPRLGIDAGLRTSPFVVGRLCTHVVPEEWQIGDPCWIVQDPASLFGATRTLTMAVGPNFTSSVLNSPSPVVVRTLKLGGTQG